MIKGLPHRLRIGKLSFRRGTCPLISPYNFSHYVFLISKCFFFVFIHCTNIIVNETWIHFYTPETKQQSKEWTAPDEPAQKKAKMVKYTSLLAQLGKEIMKKCLLLAKKKVLFHQDKACVHTCAVAMEKLHELKFELLPYPPYPLDLAPSDFFQIPNMKKWLAILPVRYLSQTRTSSPKQRPISKKFKNLTF